MNYQIHIFGIISVDVVLKNSRDLKGLAKKALRKANGKKMTRECNDIGIAIKSHGLILMDPYFPTFTSVNTAS